MRPGLKRCLKDRQTSSKFVIGIMLTLRPDRLFFAFSVCIICLSGSSALAATDTPVSFNRQIQPILSEYCYPCHGPDSSTRKPKKHPMRLDQEKFAFEPRDDGKPVIVKGDPKTSELMRRVKATDDDIMPPASEHKTVKPEEIALLEKWIVQGAKYEKHWSIIPPAKADVPVDRTGWAKNPIDNFVAAKLAANGLQPNPEEQKARLLRRLSFDLTGLPVSAADLKAYLTDNSPNAYEKAVDRMLESDACAEQFARLWLDAVRYADTQGIHHDHARSIWPYRDWVINAFKTDMPFDQFTVEQVAGDLLPEPTIDQKIASGYNRLLPTTGEGGAIPDEYSAIYAKDRVETTSAVWLGLTTGCAICHDHKFDPITMKDFYAMTAFFRNGTQPALDSPTSGDTPPLQFVPAKADRARWQQVEAAIAEKKKEAEKRRDVARPEFDTWRRDFAATSPGVALSLAAAITLPLSATNGHFQGTAHGETIAWDGTTEGKPGPLGQAALVSASVALEKAAPSLKRDGQASYGGFVMVEDKPSGAIFSRMNKAEGYRGWDLFLTDGRPTVHIVDQWPDKALKVTAKNALKPGTWHHLLAVFDGSKSGSEAIAIYIDAKKAEVEVNNNKLGSEIIGKAPFRLGGRSDGDGFADLPLNGKVYLQDVRFYEQALSQPQIARIAADGLARLPENGEGSDALYDLFLAGFDEPGQKLQGELAALKSEESQIKSRGATTLIMEEKKDSEPTAYILTRGNYANKTTRVSATTPESLPPLASDQPHNRLGLARWIVSRDNPLTARVTVNRICAQLMGIGIVETTEDFGVKGSRPSNHDLLDWLAVDFMDSGWNYRAMVKKMVISATYQQSARISKAKIEKDPQNRLCSRGPHLRLDAEQIRDQALAASGLLITKIGGPPVRPYQPEGVWESVAMKDSNTRVYVQDKGEGCYRRSLYTFWKRVAPPPSMEILNAPSREVFCTRRDRTDTPLQAFVTMNDPQFVEAAREMASHAISNSKSFDGRLDNITGLLLARTLAKPERKLVKDLEEQSQKYYESTADAAKALIAVGDSKPDASLNPAELAAWTMVATQILNLDECLTK